MITATQEIPGGLGELCQDTGTGTWHSGRCPKGDDEKGSRAWERTKWKEPRPLTPGRATLAVGVCVEGLSKKKRENS